MLYTDLNNLTIVDCRLLVAVVAFGRVWFSGLLESTLVWLFKIAL